MAIRIPKQDLPKLLTIRELALYLDVPVSTIYLWRSRGTGPRGFKIGKQVRYRAPDVAEWVEERRDEAAVQLERQGSP
jgi:excisionase family DNA binding protein